MHIVYLLYVNSVRYMQKKTNCQKTFFSFPISLITICNYVFFKCLPKNITISSIKSFAIIRFCIDMCSSSLVISSKNGDLVISPVYFKLFKFIISLFSLTLQAFVLLLLFLHYFCEIQADTQLGLKFEMMPFITSISCLLPSHLAQSCYWRMLLTSLTSLPVKY